MWLLCPVSFSSPGLLPESTVNVPTLKIPRALSLWRSSLDRYLPGRPSRTFQNILSHCEFSIVQRTCLTVRFWRAECKHLSACVHAIGASVLAIK